MSFTNNHNYISQVPEYFFIFKTPIYAFYMNFFIQFLQKPFEVDIIIAILF